MNVDDSDIEISMRDFIPEHAAQQSLMLGGVPVRCLNEYKVIHDFDISMSAQSFKNGGIPSRCLNEYSVTRRNRMTPAEHVWHETPSPGKQPQQLELNTENQEVPWEKPSVVDEPNDIVIDEASSSEHVQAPPIIPDIESAPSEATNVLTSVHNSTVGHAGVMVTLNRVLRANKEWARCSLWRFCLG
jgi:hypothetical protein